jgi:hypothetical protein
MARGRMKSPAKCPSCIAVEGPDSCPEAAKIISDKGRRVKREEHRRGALAKQNRSYRMAEEIGGEIFFLFDQM